MHADKGTELIETTLAPYLHTHNTEHTICLSLPGEDPADQQMVDPAERERAEDFVGKVTAKHTAWATALTEDLEEAR